MAGSSDDITECPACGERTPESGVVCGHCGHRLTPGVTTPAELERRARARMDSRPLDPVDGARAVALAWRLRSYDRASALDIGLDGAAAIVGWTVLAVAIATIIGAL